MIDREALKKAENAYRQKYKEFFPGSWPDAETCTAMATAVITAYLTHAGEGAVPVASDLLRYIRQHGLLFWDPYTVEGREHKAQMLARIDAFLAAAPHPHRQDGAIDGLIADNERYYKEWEAQHFGATSTRQDGAREEIAWESTSIGYIPFVTDARYRRFTPAVQRWYKPYRCSNCTPPPAQKGGAREVVAWVYEWKPAEGSVAASNPWEADVSLENPRTWERLRDLRNIRPLTYADTTPPAPDEAVERLSEAAQREAIYSHVSAVPGVAKTAVRALHAAGYEIARSRRDVAGGV